MTPTTTTIAGAREEIAIAVMMWIVGAIGLAIGIYCGRALEAGLGALMTLSAGYVLTTALRA